MTHIVFGSKSQDGWILTKSEILCEPTEGTWTKRYSSERIEMRKNYTLLLNADFTPMSHISIQHAFKMLNRGVAVVEEEHPTELINNFWPVPTKLRLIRYVNMGWYYAKPVLWSKRGVMLRDHGKCAYCGGVAQTVDHIHPVSKGGKSTWQNTFACCLKCNQKKNDHTLEELGWKLPFVPRVPLRTELASAKIEMTEAIEKNREAK